MVKIFIEQHPLFYNKISWVMTLISQSIKTQYHMVNDILDSNISIGSCKDVDIAVDLDFFNKMKSGVTHWKDILPTGPIYKNSNGDNGILETIFYLVNCIQELNPSQSDLDHFGRFKYTSSLQYHYQIIEVNLVGQIIETLITQYPALSEQKGFPLRPSKIFISHDIDLVHSGWKVESYLALKKMNWRLFSQVLRDILLKKPFYNNIEQVMEIDKQYGYTSCFYWLSIGGKDKNGILNADYSKENLVKMSTKVADMGFTNGIHKSSFTTGFKEELSVFPFKIEHNRYHFLKFQTHEAWREIDNADLRTDASLGFVEHIGFRNSYGLPFMPFDMDNDSPYSFVEIPLHVMDGTLTQYMGLNPKEAQERVFQFISKNHSSMIAGILWHNNELTDYSHKDMKLVYFRLFEFLESIQSECITPDEIYQQFS